jgi:hypothetical protein
LNENKKDYCKELYAICTMSANLLIGHSNVG